MILTCPSCGTQYAVKDGAIPSGGRKVRCAACGHSWHQEPDSDAGEDEASAVPDEQGAGEPFAAENEPGEPADHEADLAEPPETVPVPPPDDWPDEAGDDSDWDPEKELPDAEEIEAVESETREDRSRNWLMAILLTIALVSAIALAFWFLAPDSLRRQVGLANDGPSPLQIAPGTPERQTLASGNDLVVVSGRVINPTSEPQPVPPIEAQVRDGSGRVVHSWTIAPPVQTLSPGESRSFNSLKTEVPPSGSNSSITLTLKA